MCQTGAGLTTTVTLLQFIPMAVLYKNEVVCLRCHRCRRRSWRCRQQRKHQPDVLTHWAPRLCSHRPARPWGCKNLDLWPWRVADGCTFLWGWSAHAEKTPLDSRRRVIVLWSEGTLPKTGRRRTSNEFPSSPIFPSCILIHTFCTQQFEF